LLPGERLVIDRRRDGQWAAHALGPAAFSHKIGCRRCGAEHRISSERIAKWWEEFTATGRRRDVRYLGRDLLDLRTVNRMECPGAFADA
jgi:hypothetical protein